VKLWIHLVEARIHWGFSIRTFPGSATQHSHSIPPPTTILGALAYGFTATGLIKNEIVEKNGILYSSAIEIVEDFWPIYITVSLKNLGVVPPKTLQMIKYLSAFYRAWLDIRERAGALALAELRSPIGIGYTVIPTTAIRIAIISRKRMPSEALWSIVRLGSKESIASVIAISTIEAEPIQPYNEVDTQFVFPAEIIREGEPQNLNYLRETMPFPITKDEWTWVYTISPKPGRPPLREVIIPIGNYVRLDPRKISASIIPIEKDMILIPQGIFS